MSKSIFVSTVHEDSHLIKTLEKWAQEKKLGSDVVITHETENDKRHLGKEAIKQLIKAKIEGSALVLVLIGNDTHNHNWIQAEVELANNFNKKILCVRIPSTTGAKPSILNNYEELEFEQLKSDVEI